MLYMRIAGVLSALVFAAGCGDTGSGAGGGGSPPTGPGFSIDVASWTGKATYEGASPQEGRRFILVEQLLTNTDAEPISVNPNFFTAETDTGLSVSFSASAIPDDVCTSDTSVSAGSSYSCSLLFEIPEAAGPTTLRYEDPTAGLIASAPFGEEEIAEPIECSDLSGACQECVNDECAAPVSAFLLSLCDCGVPKSSNCPCIEMVADCTNEIEPVLSCAEERCGSECGS